MAIYKYIPNPFLNDKSVKYHIFSFVKINSLNTLKNFLDFCKVKLKVKVKKNSNVRK